MQPSNTSLALLLILIPVILTSPLNDLYKRAVERREAVHQVLEDKLMKLIQSSVPNGINALLPALSEYETFKQSPKANFIHDGKGKLHFRQFRRINLNEAMSSRSGIESLSYPVSTK
ncbi:hypothetical protein PMAYCL1PPCAC_32533 [Pristionchus mayeri]|uniref:Uncharacterized protein n=1 Tax=Pristionchus mayeri TaxID=1317129 RepID=A0AAN5IDJ0_9BILA|nr:hypothetical protein PMAYCL1PPCAC_32533 [Pristionchus mayeri]